MQCDVVVIGAGGAGLRAAIEARLQGKKTAIICKSLFGKAHTVMAEGGIAAAMGNVNSNDNWQVHFRDTMRGGKFLNNWRMAELHAKEAPDRVWELETWGALFDRTKDGKISQRNFGGHEYPRLAHVGDRTGLELIRTLQQKIVSLQQEDHRRVRRLRGAAEGLRRDARSPPAEGRGRPDLRALRLRARDRPVRRLRGARGGAGHRRHRQVLQGDLELLGVHRRRARAGPARRAPRCSTWSSCSSTRPAWSGRRRSRASSSPSRCAATAACCATPRASGSCSTTSPTSSRTQYAQTEEEGDRWYEDPDNNRRPPELLPRDEVARAINSEVKAGRGSPHGGVFLDIASRRSPERDPQAAAVDVPPVQGAGRRRHHRRADGGRPDLPLRDGRRRGRPGHRRGRSCPACSRRARCAGGMHGSNRLGGNSLSDLLVFGRRAGLGAAEYADAGRRPAVRREAEVDAAAAEALAPFEPRRRRREPVHPPPGTPADDERPGRHHPPRPTRWSRRWRSSPSCASGSRTVRSRGDRQLQPGLAPGARPAEHAAGQRVRRAGGAGAAGEPRRPHPRGLPGDGSPSGARSTWCCSLRRSTDASTLVAPASRCRCATDLLGLFEIDELKKYLTEEELGGHRVRRTDMGLRQATSSGSGAATPATASSRTTPSRSTRARSSSTSSTACRPPRPRDLAVRWNCKAGKCGSCSPEINGRPRLMCMTRMSDFDADETITVTPMRTFPVIRDLVTDVSFNYAKAREIPSFDAARRRARRVPHAAGRRGALAGVPQVHRVLPVPGHLPRGPRPRGEQGGLRRSPLPDAGGRAGHAPAGRRATGRKIAQDEHGLGYCNITKCCTEVCPEHIKITDNALIPMKERVVDRKYDPLVWLGNKIGVVKRGQETPKA